MSVFKKGDVVVAVKAVGLYQQSAGPCVVEGERYTVAKVNDSGSGVYLDRCSSGTSCWCLNGYWYDDHFALFEGYKPPTEEEIASAKELPPVDDVASFFGVKP